MDVLRIIEERRSIRKYTKDTVSDDDIGSLLEAFRWGPSEGNIQPWFVIITRDGKLIDNIASACFNQGWIGSAPVVFVICVNEKKSAASFGEKGLSLYSIQSTAAAIQNMLLLAQEKGLGSCWISAFEEERLYTLMDLPEWVRPVAIITMGHPDERPDVPLRLDVTDFTYEDRFGKESRAKWKGMFNFLKSLRKEKEED